MKEPFKGLALWLGGILLLAVGFAGSIPYVVFMLPDESTAFQTGFIAGWVVMLGAGITLIVLAVKNDKKYEQEQPARTA